MVQEFKEFITKGNLVEIAVAFVMGVAFAALVQSFIDDIVMQIVAAIFGEPDFSSLTFDLGDAVIRYGSFLTATITFLMVAWVMFILVKAYNNMQPAEEEEDGPSEVDLLTQIRDQLAAR